MIIFDNNANQIISCLTQKLNKSLGYTSKALSCVFALTYHFLLQCDLSINDYFVCVYSLYKELTNSTASPRINVVDVRVLPTDLSF